MIFSFAACGGDTSDDSAVPRSTDTDKISRVSKDNKTIEMPYSTEFSFNPISGSGLYNRAVGDLMFEGLFDLDDSMNPIPVLCEDFSTEDGIEYTFNIKKGIRFHDGTELTAADVVYSINQAKKSEMYSRRFACLKDISAASSTTVKATLKYSNYGFPTLLDIRIVKSGTLGNRIPTGTGPYVYSSDGPCLIPFDSYRDPDAVFTEMIGLVDIDSVDFAEAFESGQIDIVTVDPADNVYKYVNTDYDMYYFDTTILQYIGFNFGTFYIADPAVRTAISCLVDRNYISKTIMKNNVRSSPLILNPRFCSFYDNSWETGRGYSKERAGEILEAADIRDRNDDGWLDYPLEDNFRTISFKFIVNKDNPEKVAAAKYITETLNDYGFKTELAVLTWDDYLYALTTGDFSMYYAEAGIAPNYNFTPLLEPGGAMNYGKLTNNAYAELNYALLSADSEAAQMAAAKAFCDSIGENSPIIPICYKKYAVMTHRNQIEGFSPTISNIFFKKQG